MQFKTFENFLGAINYPEHIASGLIDHPCELCGSSEFELVRDFVDAGDDVRVPIKVKSCKRCGYLMQNPRPPYSFFEYYYNNFYSIRRSLSDKNKSIQYAEPSGNVPFESVDNQIKRAKNLHDYLDNHEIPFNKEGRLFDIGCGGGGFLKYFQDLGLEVSGSDPDLKAVEAAKKFFDIDISSQMSENFEYDGIYDIFTIMGSLEHCVNPNQVLESIANASKDGTILIHEGRSFPLSYSYKFLNFNHHRYLLRGLASAMLAKHGFKTLISTDDPICGEALGRDGNGYVITVYDKSFKPKNNTELLNLITQNDLGLNPKSYIEFLDEHDKKLDCILR